MGLAGVATLEPHLPLLVRHRDDVHRGPNEAAIGRAHAACPVLDVDDLVRHVVDDHDKIVQSGTEQSRGAALIASLEYLKGTGR